MYGKVFDSIYDGTLYGHWEAIVTMQQLIVLATPDGVVDMTPQAIAARTSIPFEIIEKGLKILADPDPYTRTPGDEGRRIVLLDEHRPWGWRLVNHGKYMRLRDIKQKREADRVRISGKRKKIKDVAIESPSVANVAHLDLDLDLDSNNNKEGSRFALPAWINPKDWQGFEASRKKLRKPMTDLARDLVVLELNKLRGAGHDPSAVLLQSIRKGWQDVFPLKAEAVPAKGNGATRDVDYQCQQFVADGKRCPNHAALWNIAGTKGNCSDHGPL
jgi:hypothetical protein